MSLAIILLLLAACGGSSDEAVQDTSGTDTGAVDETTDSETIDDTGIGATGSEDDSGGLPPTPDSGSKVSPTRTIIDAAALDTAVATLTPPTNRTDPQNTAVTNQMDILFLLDASGSMAEELATLKASIDGIVSRLSTLPSASLRYGFVTYRDQTKTDSSQTFELTDDWALFATNLNAVTAVGGGDYAEDLSTGLYQAITSIDWQPDAVRLLILLGDAPPHIDTPGTVPYDEALLLASEQNITIYTIGSNDLNEEGIAIYKDIAQSGNGRFISIPNSSENAQTADLATAIVDIVLEVLNDQSP